ncbi:MAG: PilW family protein [Pseudomonadota bacterium]
MNIIRKIFRFSSKYTSSNKGLTLVELMVVMGLATIVLAVIYAAYNTQSRMNRKETAIVNMQQNIRGSLYLIEKEIRMAGYDPEASGKFGIKDIKFKDIDGSDNVNGYSSITFTADNGAEDTSTTPPTPHAMNGQLDSNETYTYRIYNYTAGSPAGILDLGRKVGGGGITIVAEGIDAIGFAYAYDNDGDGQLDVSSGGGNVLWAIDTDNNNKLDSILDTTDNGVIDIYDDEAGTTLPSEIDLDKIRAIRVWILARTKTTLLDYNDSHTYVVANRRITPNDNYKRELLETIIKCRNLGF